MSEQDVVYYDFDNFRLDLQKEQLLKDGEPVLLTHKAYQTLHILVQNCGQVVEKETIYNSIWSDSFVEEGNLTQYVYLLRKILNKNFNGEPYIETIARRGYIFNAPVRKVYGHPELPQRNGKIHITNENNRGISDSIDPSYTVDSNTDYPWLLKNQDSDFSNNIQRTEFTDTGEIEWKPDRVERNVQLLRILVVAAAAVAIVFVGYNFFRIGREPRKLTAEPGVNSLAVLPFKQIGAETQDTKVGFGMADAIITRLSSLQQIPVRPSSSVFKYSDEPNPNPAQIGADLGVDAILEGTVQREGERVRVSVQLFNINEGKPMWAEKFDEKYSDVFSLQDSIASKVAGSLALKLTSQQAKALTQRPTNSAVALEAYQSGVYYWNKRTKENLERAEKSFLKAIEIDPNYAKAYAMLADTYNMIGYYGYADNWTMQTKATSAVSKALMLDNTIPEAHIANAFLQFRPYTVDAARMSIERAIELAPYNATARLRHSWILLRYQKLDEAVAEMRLAREYDPQSPVSTGALCSMLMYKSLFDEAVDVCRHSVELSGDELPVGRLGYSNALFFKGRVDEAIAEAQKDFDAGINKYSALGNIGYYYAKSGKTAEAESIVNTLRDRAKENPMLLVDLTLINYALGKKEDAFAYYQQAAREKVLSVGPMRYDPVWKDVLNDARFAEVIKESPRPNS